MCVLGMYEELKDAIISVNELWSKTAIVTAVVEMLGIMADAAYILFYRRFR